MPTCSARDPGRQPFQKDANRDAETKVLKMRFLPLECVYIFTRWKRCNASELSPARGVCYKSARELLEDKGLSPSLGLTAAYLPSCCYV